MMIKWPVKKAVLAISLVLSSNVMADAQYDALKSKVDLLTKQLLKVQSDLEATQKQAVTKDDIAVLNKKIKQASASTIPNSLVHLAGYADVGYSDGENMDGTFSVGTFSPIVHFQYRDLIMLESELEFKVGADGETIVGLEYLTADIFVNDYLTFIAGKFLSPVGQFRQNIHPSWINKLPTAAPGFGHDGAAPLSDLGIQIRGGFPLSGMRTNYALYVSNGPELLAGYDAGEFELDGVDSEAKGKDNDGEKVFGGRFGVIPFAGLELGLSLASGKATVTGVEDDSGTAPSLAGEQARSYDVLSFDMAWQSKGFELRGEYVESKVGQATKGVSASAGASWKTWYAQTAYRFMPKYEAVVRYTDFDSPNNLVDQQQWALGINYLFASNVVSKIAYESNSGQANSVADADRIFVQLSYGF